MEAITSQNFHEKTKELCIVKFGTEWCAPCKLAKNMLLQIEKEVDIPIYEIDAEKNRDIFDLFGLRKIPSVMLYKGALPVYHFDQNTTKHQYLDLIARYKNAGHAKEVSG